MTEIPFQRELLPPGFNAEAVAFTVATVQDRGDLSHRLLACLLAIVRHVNDETGLANVGWERLMELTGTNRRNTLGEWLTELKELGYITKAEREGPNGSNLFRVPILTYLPYYQEVGVSKTDTHTNQEAYKELDRTLITYKDSMSNENRYSDWSNPLPSRAIAIEEAGEDAVLLSERFTKTLIDHGRKHARYSSDAYRRQWLQAFITLDFHVKSEVALDFGQLDYPRSDGDREHVGSILSAEVQARFDAVFEFIASYQGDDPGIKYMDHAEQITSDAFDHVLSVCDYTGPLNELQPPKAPAETPEERPFIPHGPGWERLQEIKARKAQREANQAVSAKTGEALDAISEELATVEEPENLE